MGSYAELVLGPFLLDSNKYDINPLTMMLFRESDKRVHKATPDELRSRFGNDIDLEQFSENEITIVQYACPVSFARDRLELLGFTQKAAQAQFERGVEEEIAHYENWGRTFASDLTALRQMNLESWLACLKEIRQKRLKPRTVADSSVKKYRPLMRYVLTTNLYGFPGDFRHFLRLLVDVSADTDELVYDLTDLVAAGDVKEADNLVGYADELISNDFLLLKKIIIITEGETDRWILQRSLRLLYPHLFDYFHFLDFEGTRAEGGAGQLANIVKAFAGAGIINRIVALFDNDTAAESAIRSLSTVKLPRNIVLRKYPSLALADNYPTQGPTGVICMNVNGLAGSIELYLGREILQNPDGSFTPVQWKGHDPKLRKYQGEITNKIELQNRFSEKLAACEANHSRISEFDWEGIRSVFDVIRTAFKGA